jgi:LPS export ABC transporter protein LptC
MTVGSPVTSSINSGTMRNSIFIILALVIVSLFSACRNDPAKVKSLTQKDTLPLLTTQQVDMLVSDSARLKMHLTSPREEDFAGDDQRSVFPQGVYIEIYDDSGGVNSSVQSQYAERSMKDQTITAKQKVVVINIKGEKLETEKLMLDERTQRIYTDAFVKITTADQVIMGNGLDADAGFTEYEIKDITGTLMLNE